MIVGTHGGGPVRELIHTLACFVLENGYVIILGERLIHFFSLRITEFEQRARRQTIE